MNEEQYVKLNCITSCTRNSNKHSCDVEIIADSKETTTFEDNNEMNPVENIEEIRHAR